jgi:hypothetical protein
MTVTRLAGRALEVRREAFRDGGADVPATLTYVRDSLQQFLPRTVLADVAGCARLVYPNGIFYFRMQAENQNRQVGIDSLQVFENFEDASFSGNGADYRRVPILSGRQPQRVSYGSSFAKNASRKMTLDEVFEASSLNGVRLQDEDLRHLCK